MLECQLCHRKVETLVDGRFKDQRVCQDCRDFQDERAAGRDFLSQLQNKHTPKAATT